MSLQKSKSSPEHSGTWEYTVTEIKGKIKNLVISGNPSKDISPYGDSIKFNGENDGFFLPVNPLAGLEYFTVEALIRPDPDGPEEQRFLHIGEVTGDRLLVETRSTKDGQWYLDTYIQSGQSQRTLIDPALIHPAGKWYHVAMTLDKNGQMTNYVNGMLELKGNVDFRPLNYGEMSVGVRRNKVSWYRGAIYKIRITPEVLHPEDFIKY